MQFEATMGIDYKKLVYRFYESMVENKVSLIYEGEINQEITSIFSQMAEAGMENTEHETTKRRVYHVMVECLQNICKHSDGENDTRQGSKGILLVTNDEEQYSIITGNIISNDNVSGLTEMLEKINAMTSEELKTNYKRMIKESRISDKGGAGLGFIDMVKKTGNSIEYVINPLENEEDKSFLVIVSRVDRITPEK